MSPNAGIPVLARNHLLGHVKKQATVAFLYASQQPAKTTQVTRFFSGGAPRDVIPALPLGKVRQFGWFFAVIEELVERHFHRSRQFFQGLDGRNGMPVLDARDVAAQQTRALFDVALGKLLGFTQ